VIMEIKLDVPQDVFQIQDISVQKFLDRNLFVATPAVTQLELQTNYAITDLKLDAQSIVCQIQDIIVQEVSGLFRHV